MDSTAIIIHGLIDAQAAIGRDPAVTLRSAPGAALYAGALWWRELIRLLREEGDWRGQAFLDCAGEAGLAVEAIHCGVTHLILDPNHPLFDAIEALARQSGGWVWKG